MAATLLALSLVASPVGAAEHGAPWPEHGHILLLHMEYDADGEPESYGRCIDIANGKKLDRVHHTTIHMGRAGAALQSAGHMVVPTTEMAPWKNCAEFAVMVQPPR